MMVRGVFSADVREQYEATQKFRKLLSIGAYFLLFPSVRNTLLVYAPSTAYITLCLSTHIHRAQPAHRRSH
jgi:hypothetical protein